MEQIGKILFNWISDIKKRCVNNYQNYNCCTGNMYTLEGEGGGERKEEWKREEKHVDGGSFGISSGPEYPPWSRDVLFFCLFLVNIKLKR